MNLILQNDSLNIEVLLDSIKKLSIVYLRGLDERPASVGNPSLNLPGLPEKGLGAMHTQQLFEAHCLKNIVSSAGSRYWGYVTGGCTPASIAGDWLTTVFDQNTQNIQGEGDVSAALEIKTGDLLLELFGLPTDFIGAFVTGATMSNFTCLAVARQWVGRQMGKDIALEGLYDKIKIYSSVPHSSSIKSLSMLGIGRKNIDYIIPLPGRESMDMEALETQLKKNPTEPFILLSSAGTVNMVDFDNLEKIRLLKNKYTFWWHIDAAFGGFAACSPDFAYLVNGWGYADSITIDFHKWLNVPYDNAIAFTRKEHRALQIQTFQNTQAPYLGDPSANFNFLNFVPENSRRCRALPVWFSLMAYGKEGYRGIVENSIRLAALLGERIQASSYFMLAAPVHMNVVCFTVKKELDREKRVMDVLKRVNERGIVFMTATHLNKLPCIRAALVNWRTTEKDIQIAMNELNNVLENLNA